MRTETLTPAEIRRRGYDALLRELGPLGYVRFLQEFEPGRGDYTRDRHQWLDRLSHEDWKAMLKKVQEKRK